MHLLKKFFENLRKLCGARGAPPPDPLRGRAPKLSPHPTQNPGGAADSTNINNYELYSSNFNLLQIPVRIIGWLSWVF